VEPAKPIVSTRAEDPECEERIDAFVVDLGERVDQLQDADLAGDREALVRLAALLGAEAEELGYPALVAATVRVRDAGREEGAEGVHKAVRDLTEVSQRIRRGHRSSA
jgi:hypothetical protein